MHKVLNPTASYSNARYKLFWINCNNQPISNTLIDLNDLGIPTLNIGLESSIFLKDKITSKYRHLEFKEFIEQMIFNTARTRDTFYSPTVGIYNLGILFEPSLQLNPSVLIKNLSKEICIVILWEHYVESNAVFSWDQRPKEYSFDFTDTNIHKIDLQHEVQ